MYKYSYRTKRRMIMSTVQTMITEVSEVRDKVTLNDSTFKYYTINEFNDVLMLPQNLSVCSTLTYVV